MKNIWICAECEKKTINSGNNIPLCRHCGSADLDLELIGFKNADDFKKQMHMAAESDSIELSE